MQGVFLVVASVVGGKLSDRTGRRKVFVLTASCVYGLSMFVIALASDLNGFLVGMAIGGLGFGMYAAVDLALVVDVLPDHTTAAKGPRRVQLRRCCAVLYCTGGGAGDPRRGRELQRAVPRGRRLRSPGSCRHPAGETRPLTDAEEGMLVMATPELIFETERLRARPMVLDDLEPFVAYRADPEVARFQSWSDFSLADGRALLAALEGSTLGTPGEWYQIALEDRAYGGLVGDLAAKVSGIERREMELGFTLAPARQGKGYGTEALRALLDVAFGTLGMHRVIAVTDALNAPAAALLERVGMRREAHFRENIFFKGTWGSEFLFAVLEHEWGSMPSAGHP